MYPGSVDPGLSWAFPILLLSLRLTALLTVSPLFQGAPMPPSAKALLVVGLSAALALGLPAGPSWMPRTPGDIVLACLREAALGATLGVGILVAFAAFSTAGRLLDVQAGFGIGQVFDPLTRTQIPVLTAAFNQIAVLMFFVVDGHHALLRGIAISIEHFPLGQPWSIGRTVQPLVTQAASLLSLGFALAAPVVFCLLLVELALGIVSRNLPQINMLILGIPVKLMAGVLALALWFGVAGGVMQRLYGSIFTTWAAVFAGATLEEGR